MMTLGIWETLRSAICGRVRKIQAVFQSKETKNYELLKLLTLGTSSLLRGTFSEPRKER